MSALSANYKASCNAYIKAFEKKHGIEFDFWIADKVGGVASFNCEYVFDMGDITDDIDTKQSKGFILKWQQACIDNQSTRINYKAWCMGLRFDTAHECGRCGRLHTRCECEQNEIKA